MGVFLCIFTEFVQEDVRMIALEELLQDGEVWFLVTDKKEFLSKAKEFGCVWINGAEIDVNDDCFFHMSISNDKRIANVSMSAWLAPQFKDKTKYAFEDFLTGKNTCVKAHTPSNHKNCKFLFRFF